MSKTSTPSGEITEGQEKKYRRILEDTAKHGADLALEKVDHLDKEGMQALLMQGDKLKTAIVEVIVAKTRELSTPSQIVVVEKSVDLVAPANLAEILKNQVKRLLEVDSHKALKIGKGKYKDQLMAAVTAFQWREELAAIGLDQIALIDYRLSGEFLAKTGGVNTYIDSDRCTNYEGVMTPGGILVIQVQWGPKYRAKTPRWCRQNFHVLEQGGVVKEGLTAVIYHDKALLKKCYMDLPGSVSEDGNVPYLGLWDGEPELDDNYDSDANPNYGSVSRGR